MADIKSVPEHTPDAISTTEQPSPLVLDAEAKAHQEAEALEAKVDIQRRKDRG